MQGASQLAATFEGLASVTIESATEPASVTHLVAEDTDPPLDEVARYDATFERDWTIGSFSAFVRQLERIDVGTSAIVDPAIEEELLTGPDEAEVEVASKAARHRFPRGPRPGNFLHDQLEWLAEQGFAIAKDATLRSQFVQRVERYGDRQRAEDLATWMTEIVTKALPPIGRSLDALERVLPEMEFWMPSEGIAATAVDAACRAALLDGRARPALAERQLRGMLMGFADLVFEADGRYWVLDYKSNALGLHDRDYTRDALADAMATHRYDVQAAIYLLALHRLLRQRLGARYDPATQLGGALYLFIRGIEGPEAGCHVVPADLGLIETLDRMARERTVA
jgi:exodeoxyribonuclease V beta subunit